ncbi:MAG: kelch repeat-containing protein [Gammaproteobacteria bacterium]
MMNNGEPNPNWSNWLDQTDAGPNPNDILGGAVGAMTMQMGEGTAVGSANDQTKAFQYGVQVDLATGGFRIESQMLNFGAGFQLYPFAGDGELGIFFGDGSQSEFVQFTVDESGVEVLQETSDTPQVVLSAAIAVNDRPNESLAFRLDIDSASGGVEAFYSIDGGAFTSIGSFTAQGQVLNAIQQSGAMLTVGLIGTSNTLDAEVEGTWDYLNVIGRRPAVELPIPDIDQPIGGQTTLDINLDAYFSDDNGDGNLLYTIESTTDPSIGAGIAGNILTLNFPSFVASSTLVIRATDSSGLYVEQSFSVSVIDPVAIYRINAGGMEIPAIDGGIAWAQDTTANNSQYLSVPGSNNQAGFSMTGYIPGVDQATTPTQVYSTERWAGSPGTPSMAYAFPVSPGSHEVRLYMGNGWSGASSPGQRVFSVEIEGVAYNDLTDLDLTATFGHQIGGLVTHVVDVADNLLEIEFFHGSANNPMLNGIEIISGVGTPPIGTPITVAAITDQTSAENSIISLPVIASGGDTPASFAFSATGLPGDLQIEPTTGLIFGTIASGAHAGSPYAVSITVDDNDTDPTDTVTTNFSWTITDPNLVTWIDKAEDESYTGRHECSFVQAGDKFYLFGGRENAQTLDTYDYTSNSWFTSASAPLPFNHFQATEYQGLIWVVGAFETNNFPNEDPAANIWVFDPANDAWTQGPQIPVARRRGGSGLVVYDDKFYMVGGNTLGHDGGYVPWFDEFDPSTGTFTPLTDAPRPRDHFHAVVFGDKLYVIGGRLTGGPGGTFAPLIAEVDVYNFTTGNWSTLAAASNLPTPRAASAMAVFDGRILVIGGEGGGQAYATVEALNPIDDTWEAAAPLNYARHGTQAIVSGAGVYVTAGSPNQGGGNQKNMEVYDQDLPAGSASIAGTMTLPASAQLAAGFPATISLTHDGGNQAIYASTVTISGVDAADFAFVNPVDEPLLIRIGESRQIEIEYLGAAENATASLVVSVNGGVDRSVDLVAVPTALLDRDDDGIPDLVEIANGLDPLLASDALDDADGDFRSNLDEYLDGGQITVADTGDVNGDHVIDISDLLLMQQHLTDLRSLDVLSVSRGDFDRDALLSVHDLLRLESLLAAQDE